MNAPAKDRELALGEQTDVVSDARTAKAVEADDERLAVRERERGPSDPRGAVRQSSSV
jgi:hypothetical protein